MRTPGSDIIVLDVEGTDGRERGEDQVPWADYRHMRH